MKKTNVGCIECGHIYDGHTNNFGKVCLHCAAFIPTSIVMPIVMENKHKLQLAQHKLRQYLLRKTVLCQFHQKPPS